MNVLADTHVAIWAVITPENISANASAAFADAERQGGLYIADISLWEIAMLIQKQRFYPGTSTEEFLQLMLKAYNFSVVCINAAIAATAVLLPANVNKDPADRIIVATALSLNIPLISADTNLRSSSVVTTIW
jgi:PIN domain nuclease of toxin-antitoxin system